jgi:exportin-5
VFKAVILFGTHALQMHDNRCCSTITRVLRSLVGEFTETNQIASEIREFISTDVLKACIVSLHDPYFVDTQVDLAQLIATIIKKYCALTDTPRQILLSLPGMEQPAVDGALHRILKEPGSKIQRAVVLKLLENLRGITISEQGRLSKPDSRKVRSALQEKYMTPDQPKGNNSIQREPSPDLGGVADMFA